jgi:AcrR family transcriptional regulator
VEIVVVSAKSAARRGVSIMRDDCDIEKDEKHREIIEITEKLFREIGFRKVTIADIARKLDVSPASIYRFFSAECEINEEVCRHLFGKLETAADDASQSSRSASESLRKLIISIDELNVRLFQSSPKLNELLCAAFDECWPIVREHDDRIDEILSQIISRGGDNGEFRVSDADLAAILVRTTCLRFFHPRMTMEYWRYPEPTVDQIIDFCLTALGAEQNEVMQGKAQRFETPSVCADNTKMSRSEAPPDR